MSLEQWVSGEQITKTKLNAMVDKVNTDQGRIDTLETTVAGKPDVCSTTPQPTSDTGAIGSSEDASRCDHVHEAVGDNSPQDVASSASVGTQTLASRQDHVHRGVSRIIAGDNITISPTSGYGAVTVNGAAAAGGVTKVELPFSGTYTAGQEIVSDTPDSDELPVAIYAELTTVSGGLEVAMMFNDQYAGYLNLNAAGQYLWQDMQTVTKYASNDARVDAASNAYGWKIGYKISLKADVAGTGSGKLIIYYATIT